MPAPRSPASDFGDLAAGASADSSGEEAPGGAAALRGCGSRGRGRGPADGVLVPHGAAADAARGRGGARGPRAPAVSRGSRMIRWGRPQWSFGRTVAGWGADCRCHQNEVDLPGITNKCRKNMPYSMRSPLTDDEHRRLCKIWLLCGEDVEHGITERSDHVSINPRDFYLGFTEDQLDEIASTL